MPHTDPRFDEYIDNAADFAKPILIHLRKLVHQADPNIVESIKWGHLFFGHDKPVCMMGAFKSHCNFGFWGADQLPDPEGQFKSDGQQSLLHRLYTVADLPADDILIWYIKNAVEHSISKAQIKGTPKVKVRAVDLTMPNDFNEALEDNSVASEIFRAFSPSKRNDYISWILEAKTEATRVKRIATAVEWIAEGKTRQWKYQ